MIKHKNLFKLGLSLSILTGVLLCNNVTVEAKIYVNSNNISYICQLPSLPTGCELTALEILMRGSGFKVTKEDLARKVKKAPMPKWVNGVAYGEHPNNAFIGDPFKEKSFGIYSKGVIDLMCEYMPYNNIQDLTGSDFSVVESVVREGRPVMVWSTLDQKEPKNSTTWITPNDGKFTWKSGEHALVVVGYNDKYVWTSDPAKGVLRKYPKGKFVDIYNKMGKQAIAIYKEPLAYKSTPIVVNGQELDKMALVGLDDVLWFPVKALSNVLSNWLSVGYSNGTGTGTITINTYNTEGMNTLVYATNNTNNNNTNTNTTVLIDKGVTYVSKDWLMSELTETVITSIVHKRGTGITISTID